MCVCVLKKTEEITDINETCPHVQSRFIASCKTRNVNCRRVARFMTKLAIFNVFISYLSALGIINNPVYLRTAVNQDDSSLSLSPSFSFYSGNANFPPSRDVGMYFYKRGRRWSMVLLRQRSLIFIWRMLLCTLSQRCRAQITRPIPFAFNLLRPRDSITSSHVSESTWRDNKFRTLNSRMKENTIH